MLTPCHVLDVSDHRGQLAVGDPDRCNVLWPWCGVVVWCEDRCRWAGRIANCAVAVTASGTDAPALEDTRGDVPNVHPTAVMTCRWFAHHRDVVGVKRSSALASFEPWD